MGDYPHTVGGENTHMHVHTCTWYMYNVLTCKAGKVNVWSHIGHWVLNVLSLSLSLLSPLIPSPPLSHTCIVPLYLRPFLDSGEENAKDNIYSTFPTWAGNLSTHKPTPSAHTHTHTHTHTYMYSLSHSQRLLTSNNHFGLVSHQSHACVQNWSTYAYMLCIACRFTHRTSYYTCCKSLWYMFTCKKITRGHKFRSSTTQTNIYSWSTYLSPGF